MSHQQISESKRVEFARLFGEFATAYIETSDGQAHIAYYVSGREQARKNMDALIAAAEQGEDITEAILFKLLPYSDSPANREAGRWISIAPAFAADVRVKFEAAGWTKSEDWPRVAQAIFAFVRQCVEHPEQLAAACADFSALPYSKGFQTGTLTPILNALQPDAFVLVNNKSRQVINHFAGTKFGQKLIEYPETNDTAHALIAALASEMREHTGLDVRPADLFDMFSHWLVAVKHYAFGASAYWKVAPGANAWNWGACREGDFIAIGWESLGDLSGASREEFDRRCALALQEHPDWKQAGLEQVWRFAHEIKEGDRIIANRGVSEILGVGTVIGPYEFLPGVRHGHRLPVEWDDLTPRQINEPGWRKTLIKLDRKKFDQLIAAPLISQGEGLAAPFYRIFADPEEARWAFDFLRHTLTHLGVSGPDDERFALTLRHNHRTLRLNYGSWAVLQFYGSETGLDRVGIAFLEDRVSFDVTIARWETFATDDNRPVRVYELPIAMARNLSADLQAAYETTFAYIGERFGNWVACPFRRFNQPEIAAAVFAPEKREALLKSGLDTNQLVHDIDEEDELSNGYFDAHTFSIAPEYPLAECAKESGFDEENLARWVRAIERKGQAILYGPPGTGKTYVAEQLAQHLFGGGDGFCDLIQFHPAYAYEDFIQGLRPQAREGGGLDYPLVPGRFLEFCAKAAQRKGRCVLIIDEINRANLARVFGELMYLLEYRDREIPLAGGRRFSIPGNVRIIGTMNTADRSIALVDHALRRRFAFLSLYPNYGVLRRYHRHTGFSVEGLIRKLEDLNKHIGDPHYYVGITFFLRERLASELPDIWKMEIEPYLEEYFFDQPGSVAKFRWSEIASQVLP